jgi:hypothetical protein
MTKSRSPTEEGLMSVEGEALVTRFFEEFCNGRRSDVADEIVAEELQQVGAAPAPA